MKSLVKYVQDEFITQNEYPEFKSGDQLLFITKLKKVKNLERSFLKELLFK